MVQGMNVPGTNAPGYECARVRMVQGVNVPGTNAPGYE